MVSSSSQIVFLNQVLPGALTSRSSAGSANQTNNATASINGPAQAHSSQTGFTRTNPYLTVAFDLQWTFNTAQPGGSYQVEQTQQISGGTATAPNGSTRPTGALTTGNGSTGNLTASRSARVSGPASVETHQKGFTINNPVTGPITFGYQWSLGMAAPGGGFSATQTQSASGSNALWAA